MRPFDHHAAPQRNNKLSLRRILPRRRINGTRLCQTLSGNAAHPAQDKEVEALDILGRRQGNALVTSDESSPCSRGLTQKGVGSIDVTSYSKAFSRM
jgi:hypothetical protein